MDFQTKLKNIIQENIFVNDVYRMAVVLFGFRCAYKTQMSSASWQVLCENGFPMLCQLGVRKRLHLRGSCISLVL